jgi:UDP-glucose 4-epimerase
VFRRPFVSGGAGFIGSHLVGRLLQSRDVEGVTVYDNFTSGTSDHLRQYRGEKRLAVVDADIKHLGELTSAMRGCDVVFHLAANPDIAKAARQPDIDFWEGTYLTQNVLEAMRIDGISQIVYTSGSGVYGERPNNAFAENYGPCFPISTYGASKLACEALISSYAHMFGIMGRAFRFANVVGPRQTHGVGYDFARRLRADETRLRILGDGTQCKAYIHIEDVLNAVFLVMEQAKGDVPFDVYNVATDDYITVNEIADIVVEGLGLVRSSVEYAYSGGDRGWKGDVPKVLFDVAKIKSLGWSAERTSKEAVRDSIREMIVEIDEPVVLET